MTKSPLSARARDEVFFKEGLDRIRKRLKQSIGAAPVRSEPNLDMAQQLSFHQGQIGHRKHEAAKDHDTFNKDFNEKI